MDLDVAGWYAAIPERHSRRVFDGRPIDRQARAALAGVCEGFNPFAGVRASLIDQPAHDVFVGLPGGYGKVVGAPAILVFSGTGDDPSLPARIGYVGEAAVLEATRLGLGTCWVGGFFSRSRTARIAPDLAGERILAVSPVGHPVAGKTSMERTLSGLVRSHKRLATAEIAPGVEAGYQPAWVMAAVEAARLAPSATNRQPWRFRVEDGAIVVSTDHGEPLIGIPRRLDCGIAMLHLELGARAHGVPGAWEILDTTVPVATRRGFDVARYVPDRGSA